MEQKFKNRQHNFVDPGFFFTFKNRKLSKMFSDWTQFVAGHHLLNTFQVFQTFSSRNLIVSYVVRFASQIAFK